MNSLSTIKVNYEKTYNSYTAKKWLDGLPDLFAADFEVASKFTATQKELIKYRLNQEGHDKRVLQQQLVSDGLSHPSLTVVTHLSVAWSEQDSYVIICNTESIRNLVFNFLISTEKTQLWHNCCFDFKHVSYHTGKIPKKFEDTQLIAKSLLNDADSFRDRVGLKGLMSYCYGDWALSKDTFTLEDMYNENMLRYAATDSCSTYKLYNDMLGDN